MFELDPLLLARIQFAFTISFHIVFPTFTIGLASWLAVLEWRYLKTDNPIYASLYKLWVKVFAVTFGLGVVSGVVLSYQIGTNWSLFSDKVGNVLGPLLGYEVLTAFFLEASFLGIMLFGWGKVSKRMHFFATIVVAIGTLISAFWILSANSWMQTPQGYMLGDGGLLHPKNWLDVIFNPSFPYRYIHMVSAAFLTTAFAVGGIGAFYLLKQRHIGHAKVILGMAMVIMVFLAPLQIVIGDFHGLNTLQHQPRKVAAMEGIWETEKGAGLRLFALPDQAHQLNYHEIKIPGLASLILTHHFDGKVVGLKHWARDEQPPVAVVFWSFRVMVGLGLLMAAMGVWVVILFIKKRLFESPWFLRCCVAMTPSGFFAVLAGWFVTEVGRQPYTVFGVLRTSDSVAPIGSTQLAISLAMFIVVYLLIFGAGVYYIAKVIRKGPTATEPQQELYEHGLDAALIQALKNNREEN